jgi:hypothetical protein
MTAFGVAQERRDGSSHTAPGEQASSAIDRIFGFDLSRPWAFVALALAFVASRAPFIDNGYGTKPDAWRIALSGYWLWDHHEFYPSRLPGYPVPELSYATVVNGGWIATNSLTIAVSLLGLWFFANIVRELKLPNPALLVVGFAFQPLLWINSMNTMDYAWALTFILGAYYFLITEETGFGGLMLGLAIGSRLPSAIMLLPFVVYLVRDDRRHELREFLVWSVVVPMVAFLPIIWTYGAGFLNFYDAKIGVRTVIRLLAKDSVGLLGTAGIGLGVLLSMPRLAKLPRDFLHDKHVMTWVLAIAGVAFVFSRLPHEAAYLIPLFPFAFLLVGRYFSRWVLAGTIAMMLIASFADLTTTNHEVSLVSVTKLRLGQGMLLSNRDTENAQLTYTRDIENHDLPDNSVISIGFLYPQFAVLNRNRMKLGILVKDTGSISQLTDKGKAEDPVHHRTFVWLLDYTDFEKFKKQGATLLYTQDAGISTAALYGYRPGVLGGKVLDLGRSPSGASGTARTDR